MYHVSAQDFDERMINVHYYYYLANNITQAVSPAATVYYIKTKRRYVTQANQKQTGQYNQRRSFS